MSAHTPTPWKANVLDCFAYDSRGSRVARCDYPDEVVISYEQQVANTEFIVRACNSHDALVAALKIARDMIVKDAEESGFPLNAVGKAKLEKIESALASIKNTP